MSVIENVGYNVRLLRLLKVYNITK